MRQKVLVKKEVPIKRYYLEMEEVVRPSDDEDLTSPAGVWSFRPPRIDVDEPDFVGAAGGGDGE